MATPLDRPGAEAYKGTYPVTFAVTLVNEVPPTKSKPSGAYSKVNSPFTPLFDFSTVSWTVEPPIPPLTLARESVDFHAK